MGLNGGICTGGGMRARTCLVVCVVEHGGFDGHGQGAVGWEGIS